MKKRIFMIGYSTDKGGVESYIRNLSPNLESEFEVILHWPEMEIDGRIWHAPRNRHNIFKYNRFWKRFFKENHFDAVYFNTCDVVSIDMLKFAKQAGVPVRIIHSHSTGNQFHRSGLWGGLHKFMEYLSRVTLHKYATDLLACSKSAGDWMFDGRAYTVIKNGIDIDKYAYSEIKKERVAKSLKHKSDMVVACLGRVEGQKNPFFSFEVFRKVCELNPDVQCLFIGDGAYRRSLEALVQSSGLSDRILFTGGIDNVSEWLSYVDCILMPSLFEGLPFALVEAQAAGIHSLVSDKVSVESNITGLVEYKSLNDSTLNWAKRLLELAVLPRVDVTDQLIEAGFSIGHTGEIVRSIIKSKLEL